MRLARKPHGFLLLSLLPLLLQQQQQQQRQQQPYSEWYLGPSVTSAFQLSSESSPRRGLVCSGGPSSAFQCRGPQQPRGGTPGAPPARGPLRALLTSPAQEKLAMLSDGKERSGEYFIAEIGGFRKWMERGRFYDVNRIHQKEGGKLLLLRVLLLQQRDGPTLVGQPFLEHIRVWATVLRHFRAPKVRVGKHRPKKWRKLRGHRQELSRILIDRIEDVNETTGFQRSSDDPLYAALMAIRRYEKPSLHLPLYKAGGLSLADRTELPLIGEDPLALFDPKLNQLVADRLAVGHTEILPILGENIKEGERK